MSNLRWIPILGAPKEPAVSICSEGMSDADLADAIGELERCKVRYIVLPTYANLKAYRRVLRS
ncbi:hypothetical protein [Rhodoferax bucti]|uniref:hypothetical protein n=1 Tax=Rhodoferax bucti TaxID=2576305 RepID=UPI001476C86C|nr:hypothetical protein [Rhodoferax bucti]